MRNFLVSSILVVVAMLAISSLIPAQTPERSGATKGPPDLSGVWDRPRGGAGGGAAAIPGFGFAREEPAMLPWAAEKYKAARTGPLRNPFDKGIDELDPNISCFPPGPTLLFTMPRPFEFRQFPDVVLLFSEWDHWVRRIYMDGRGHPDGYPVTWMGHSMGTYEGDTLVVDTVNINDKTWIDLLGHPHSDALHVVERARRVNQDTLEINFTFEDPKAYPKPWAGKKLFQLMRPCYEILEHVICEDWLEMGKKR